MILTMLKKMFAGRITLDPQPAVQLTRDDAARVFARIFSGDDGKRAAAYLRSTVFARVSGPEAGEAQLRYLDGQRALLTTILNLAEQGK